MTFCHKSILPKVISLLDKSLLIDQSQSFQNEYDSWLNGDKMVGSRKFEAISFSKLLPNHEFYNMGIDLPVWFGDPSNEPLMIVAMDPKRSKGEVNLVSVNSVFSLHSDGKDTKRNDYWGFIQPLTVNHMVYVTDAYKLYYERKDDSGNKVISNRDPEFKNEKCMDLNRSILNEEITQLIKPSKIIALGGASATTLKSLLGTKEVRDHFTHDGIEFLFMPHVVRTVTSQTKTIGRLLFGLGVLHRNREMQKIGQTIIDYQAQGLFRFPD